MNTVLTKLYDADLLPFDRPEILRCLKVKEENEETGALLSECISEAQNCFSYKVAYTEYDITVNEKEIDLGFTKTESEKLYKNLLGCKKIILFAATVGSSIDRLINRYSRLSPAKSLILQAIGSERVEALCDFFNSEIKQSVKEEGMNVRPRFSPGYGDLSLEIQKDIFRVLDCPRRIGLSLNQSLIMSPSKSVTAIIGCYEKNDG